MRATAIRWNFREYRFLFTVVPFPETVPHFCVSVQGFTPSSQLDPSVFAEKTGQSGRLTILTGPFFALAQDGSPPYPPCGNVVATFTISSLISLLVPCIPLAFPEDVFRKTSV